MAQSGLPIYADTSALLRLSKALRAAAPAAHRAYRLAVREAAQVVLKDAQSRASFSKRIPESGRVVMTPGGVKVVFTAPDAAPIENKGRGRVRHPVYGHRDRWTDKNSHAAFAAPALDAHAEEIAAAIDKAITDAIGRVLGGI